MSKLNKVVTITAASKGIESEGAKVVANYASSKEGADTVVTEIIKNGGTAVAIQANLSNSADIKNLFEATKKHTIH